MIYYQNGSHEEYQNHYHQILLDYLPAIRVFRSEFRRPMRLCRYATEECGNIILAVSLCCRAEVVCEDLYKIAYALHRCAPAVLRQVQRVFGWCSDCCFDNSAGVQTGTGARKMFLRFGPDVQSLNISPPEMETEPLKHLPKRPKSP